MAEEKAERIRKAKEYLEEVKREESEALQALNGDGVYSDDEDDGNGNGIKDTPMYKSFVKGIDDGMEIMKDIHEISEKAAEKKLSGLVEAEERIQARKQSSKGGRRRKSRRKSKKKSNRRKSAKKSRKSRKGRKSRRKTAKKSRKNRRRRRR